MLSVLAYTRHNIWCFVRRTDTFPPSRVKTPRGVITQLSYSAEICEKSSILCRFRRGRDYAESLWLILCDISQLPCCAKYRLSELRSDCSFAQLKIGVLVRVPLYSDELRFCDFSFMSCGNADFCSAECRFLADMLCPAEGQHLRCC